MTEDDDLAPCPSCRAMIYADADRCPKCGDYVTPGAAGVRRKPAWIWIGVALAALVLLGWILSRM